MPLLHAAPLLSAVLVIGLMLSAAIRDQSLPWQVPAIASLAFLAWTLVAVAREGLFGFWGVATASFWGTQFWIDLLLAFSVGFVLLAPRARALGMSPPLWLVLIVGTGSIGLLAMFARIRWLEQRAG